MTRWPIGFRPKPVDEETIAQKERRRLDALETIADSLKGLVFLLGFALILVIASHFFSVFWLVAIKGEPILSHL